MIDDYELDNEWKGLTSNCNQDARLADGYEIGPD